ncbi:PaaI family thioesterase [Trujillonella humicola]|uniref:PaaI family thioesterase n=1 Tax=Trujillonella humicola TaxID=3383699 RepID=UPI0039063E0F
MADPLAAAPPGTGAGRREAVAELGAALRDLADAAVGTEVADADLGAAAGAVRELAERLRAVQREPGRPAAVDVPGGGVPAYNPVYGPGSPVAPMLAPGVDEQGRAVGRVTVGRAYEGFPGLVHGGVLAAVLDAVLAQTSARATGRAGVTATLTVRYRRPVPVGVPLLLTGEVVGQEGRRTCVRAGLGVEGGAGEVLADAEAVFVTPRDAPA